MPSIFCIAQNSLNGLRLDSNAKSPVLSHFSATVTGLGMHPIFPVALTNYAYSIHPRVRCSTDVQNRVYEKD